MEDRTRGVNKSDSNDQRRRTDDDAVVAYQFSGDYVLTSPDSAGAWLTATYPVDLAEVR